jgi:hypothetical protein
MQFLVGTSNYKIHEDIVSFPPSILCVDNAAAIAMSTKLTKKTCHIACHFHFVCDGVNQHLHSPQWVSNQPDSIADVVLTKTQVHSKIAPMIPIFMFTLPNFLTDYTTLSSN